MLQRSFWAGRIRYHSQFTGLLAAAALCTLVPRGAAAPVFTLTDGNSSASIDAGTIAGLNSWTVDGQNQAQQQWFWYRIGSSGGEAAINTLSAPVSSQPTSSQLSLSYANSQVSVKVVYSLLGGSAGSGASDLSQQVKITNAGSGPLDFHFFQYVDFNLNGTATGDSVLLGQNLQNKFNEALQSEGNTAFAETVSSPGADHAQAALIGVTLASLTNSTPTTLNDTTTSGPGNVTWAFEWDLTLASGGSVILSEDMNLTVPEPSTLALATTGLLGFKLLRRRAR